MCFRFSFAKPNSMLDPITNRDHAGPKFFKGLYDKVLNKKILIRKY